MIFFEWNGQYTLAVKLSKTSGEFLASLQVPDVPRARGVLLVSGCSYFPAILSNNVLLPSRGHHSGLYIDFFLMCSLGHGNGKVTNCALIFARFICDM